MGLSPFMISVPGRYCSQSPVCVVFPFRFCRERQSHPLRKRVRPHASETDCGREAGDTVLGTGRYFLCIRPNIRAKAAFLPRARPPRRIRTDRRERSGRARASRGKSAPYNHNGFGWKFSAPQFRKSFCPVFLPKKFTLYKYSTDRQKCQSPIFNFLRKKGKRARQSRTRALFFLSFSSVSVLISVYPISSVFFQGFQIMFSRISLSATSAMNSLFVGFSVPR